MTTLTACYIISHNNISAELSALRGLKGIWSTEYYTAAVDLRDHTCLTLRPFLQGYCCTMKHYSPSSDDSPIDHRHDVKLSDLRYSSHRAAPAAPADTLNMAFARAENKKGLNALSVIHGSQASLRSSIQQERERISRVTEEVQANNSALFQSPKRRPPKPPVHQKVMITSTLSAGSHLIPLYNRTCNK